MRTWIWEVLLMCYTMIVEQTKQYSKRMRYDPETNSFYEGKHESLMHFRQFLQPYGWIKESGTPPQPHWDVILMTEKAFDLGDEIEVKVIGVFKRDDGDHKFIAVEKHRSIDDFSQLDDCEKNDLFRLYPRVDAGEGWFGREDAENTMISCEKAW